MGTQGERRRYVTHSPILSSLAFPGPVAKTIVQTVFVLSQGTTEEAASGEKEDTREDKDQGQYRASQGGLQRRFLRGPKLPSGESAAFSWEGWDARPGLRHGHHPGCRLPGDRGHRKIHALARDERACGVRGHRGPDDLAGKRVQDPEESNDQFGTQGWDRRHVGPRVEGCFGRRVLHGTLRAKS
jgi:hypothetical protein